MTEQEIADWAHGIMADGREAFRKRTPSPYRSNQPLQAALFSTGWLCEDLRTALMRSDKGYCWDQAAWENPEWGRLC